MRSGLLHGWKPWYAAGIGKGLIALFVESIEALAVALGNETGLGVFL